MSENEKLRRIGEKKQPSRTVLLPLPECGFRASSTVFVCVCVSVLLLSTEEHGDFSLIIILSNLVAD